MPAETAGLPRRPAVGSTADTAIRASTAAVVLAVAGIAAYISCRHACAVVRQYGENGVTALPEPGTIDGLVCASSMVILHAARHRLPVPRLARAMLALGITASLAVNVARGWSHGLAGAAAAAWPAVALAGSYELLAWMIRTTAGGGPDHGVARPDQPDPSPWPAISPACEAGTAVTSEDGASPEPGSVHELPCSGTQVRGPGLVGPDGTDHANQAGRPVRENTGPRGPGGSAAPERATVTVPAGDVNAAAVAAYRASIREGKPLSERKLAAAFGRTSRRWARARMAEARPGLVAG